MKENNPIDEFFKKKMEEHEVAPSEAAWEKIQAGTQKQNSKAGGGYLMRAAVITVLVGLSSVFYFQRSEPEMLDKPLTDTSVEESTDKMAEPEDNPKEAYTKPIAALAPGEPEAVKAASKKAQPEPEQKPANKPAEPIIEPVDEEALLAETSAEHFDELAYTTLDLSKVESKPRYSITVKLPTVESYYSHEMAEKQDSGLGRKMWTYASNQLERVMAGEKPRLPKSEKEPELAFNLPKFLNK